MKKIYTLIITATVLLYSCKTANKAFEKGDYQDAVSLAVKKLQKDGNDDASKAILRDAYNQLVNAHEGVIRNLSNSTADSRYEKIYNEYRKLQNLYETISSSPAALRVVSPTDYSAYVLTYKEKTGEVYFEKGLALMEKGDKRSFRQAYDALRTAYRFKNDSQIKEKMDEAHDAAIVKVLLINTDAYGNMFNTGFGNNSYQNELISFQEDLIRNLRFQSNNEFVAFYSEWDARSKNITPDEVVEMRLNRLDIGRYYDETNTREVSNRVVVKQVVYKPDSVVNEYATVYARVMTTRRQYVSEGDLNITSRDVNGKYLWSDVIRGEHRYMAELASFTGDERALSDADKNLINNSRNNGFNQVRREDILREILRQIGNETNERFRNYFNRRY